MSMRKKTASQGWIRIKLGEYLAEISERHNASSNSDTPVLSVTNRPGLVASEEFFDKKVFSKDLSNYKVIRKGQFAYNPSRVNVGSIARLKEFNRGLLSPMYVVFEAKEVLDGSYLDYWISSQRFRNLVKAGTQGSVRDSLNFSALAEFPFALPPEVEQRKIVSILACVDSVIDKTQAIIDQTQTLKKGLMQELFTRGIPGRHKKFKKTEIGEIPEGWEVAKIKDVDEIITGTTPSTKKLDYYGNAFLWATPVDLGANRYVRSTEKMLSNQGIKMVRIIPKDSILIVCIGSTIGKVGMASKDMATNQQINSIVCGNNWNCHFVYYWVTKISQYLKLLAGKQAVPIVNKSNLSAFLIPKPDVKEQREIGKSLELIDDNIEKHEENIVKLNTLKSALMQVLLSGEVRVKV